MFCLIFPIWVRNLSWRKTRPFAYNLVLSLCDSQRRQKNLDRTRRDHGSYHRSDQCKEKKKFKNMKKFKFKIQKSNFFFWANCARVTTVMITFYLIQVWYSFIPLWFQRSTVIKRVSIVIIRWMYESKHKKLKTH